MDLSVVISTYNRRDLLKTAVESLRAQSYPRDRYEIILVSDGCTDGTDELYATPLSFPLTRLIRQEKRGFGLSAARNLGLRAAQGRLVMFLDDDMVADASMVEAHVRAHDSLGEQVAVCGQVRLSPDLPRTPFCQLVIGDICRLFENDTEVERFLPFQMALSWQTSFKRAELDRLGGYDDTFRSYGWEDIEFSYRASQRGWRFFYEPRAISYHFDQRYTLAAHAKRVQNAARMAPVLFDRHAELKQLIPMYLDKEPIDWRSDGIALIGRKVARQLVAVRPVRNAFEALTPLAEVIMTPSRGTLRRWYYTILASYSFVGYREGLATLAVDDRSPQRLKSTTSRHQDG